MHPHPAPSLQVLRLLSCLAIVALVCTHAHAQQAPVDAGGTAGAVQPHAQDPAAFLAENPAARAEFKQRVERHRRELLPEYEQRVATEGKARADAWLQQEATRRGRRDAQELQRKYGEL